MYGRECRAISDYLFKIYMLHVELVKKIYIYVCIHTYACIYVYVLLSVCVCVRAMSSRVHGVFAHEVARMVMTFPWHGVWPATATGRVLRLVLLLLRVSGARWVEVVRQRRRSVGKGDGYGLLPLPVACCGCCYRCFG